MKEFNQIKYEKSKQLVTDIKKKANAVTEKKNWNVARKAYGTDRRSVRDTTLGEMILKKQRG